MADSNIRQDAKPPVRPGARSFQAVNDPVRESLEELSRIADDLVDRLSADEPPRAAAAPRVLDPERREAMKETLDALDRLIDDPAPRARSVPVEVAGDRGEDMDAQLESVLTQAPSAVEPKHTMTPSVRPPAPRAPQVGPVPPTTAPPVRARVEPVIQLPALPQRAAGPPAQSPRIAEPAPPSKAVPAAARHAEVEIRENIASAAIESAMPEVRGRSAKLGWWIAAAVLLAGLAVGGWLLKPAGEPSRDASAAATIPNPPVVFKPEVPFHPPLPTPTSDVAAQVEAQGAPQQTAAHQPAPPAAHASHKSPLAAKPSPTVPAPPAAASSRAATADVAAAVIAPSFVVLPPPVDAQPSPNAPAFDATPETPSEAPAPIAPVAAEPAAVQAEPAPSPAPPPSSKVVAIVTPDRPPLAVTRVDPSYAREALRAGEHQSVSLRVLVDEQGKVVRVVVSESNALPALEAAAINAVLRWTYRPGEQDGHPARGWATERFVFERPAGE